MREQELPRTTGLDRRLPSPLATTLPQLPGFLLDAALIYVLIQEFATRRLGIINLDDYQFSSVAEFGPEMDFGELTGTGDARLFAFGQSDGVPTLSLLDRGSGQSLEQVELPIDPDFAMYDFAFWANSFYFFTAPNVASLVHRYDLQTGATTALGQLSFLVIGGRLP